MDKLCLSSYDELYVLHLESVLYIKADDHYSQVLYNSGVNFMLPYGLGRIDDLLRTTSKTTRLLRLGRTYIINLDRVIYVSTAKQSLVLADNAGNRHVLRFSKQLLRDLINTLSNMDPKTPLGEGM